MGLLGEEALDPSEAQRGRGDRGFAEEYRDELVIAGGVARPKLTGWIAALFAAHDLRRRANTITVASLLDAGAKAGQC